MSAILRKRGYFQAKYSRRLEKGVILGTLGHVFWSHGGIETLNQVYLGYKVIIIDCISK